MTIRSPIRPQASPTTQSAGARRRDSTQVVSNDPAPPRPGAPAHALREPLDDGARGLLRNQDVRALLLGTSAQFPHVVNRIAAAWSDPDVLLHLLDELLLDDRAKRQGFPLDVALELSNLRMHYEMRVAPILRRASHSRRASKAHPHAGRGRKRSEGGFASLGARLRKLLGMRF